MREIKKIIWATDGSKESEKALVYAAFFARNFGSEIIGIRVITMTKKLLHDYSRDSANELYKRVDKAAEEHKSRITSIADELSTQGLRFRGGVLTGEPSKEIVRFARTEKADLIVIGKRGHGLVDRILIGSTTIKVLRESNIPVLAVGKKDKGETIEIRNILVPVDAYEKTDSALNYAIDLAQKINATILVVYAFRLDTYTPLGFVTPPNILYELMQDELKFSSTELAKRVEQVKLKRGIGNNEATPPKISTEVIQGVNYSVAIADYASSKGIDLIVMNTHGRKGLRKFILGSVTEKVIQESACAMLVLRP